MLPNCFSYKLPVPQMTVEHILEYSQIWKHINVKNSNLFLIWVLKSN